MNQDLLSGGSSSRRSRGPGGPAVRGNASSTARAPQQQQAAAAEEADEDEHMNRVVEEAEQLRPRVRPEASQVDVDRGQAWAPSESGASNGPGGDEEGPPNKVNRGEKGARWPWRAEQRLLEDNEEEEEEEEEENNNSSTQHEEEEEEEERTEGVEEQRRREEEDGDEEEMDQDSDDFEHSAESGREEEEEEEDEEEEEEEEEGEERLMSPSLRNNASVLTNNLDSGCTHQSSSNKKVRTTSFISRNHHFSCTSKNARLSLCGVLWRVNVAASRGQHGLTSKWDSRLLIPELVLHVASQPYLVGFARISSTPRSANLSNCIRP
ncbi:cilia- and flagella-associated protein 251-like isoform X1 [Entelurus aequoreus]|uniref:cilia- and flagella-associated protein 251-like isoform X1 n=1 Tax=Entelurus aequoreus TaxID=161455 RepID=UPI002B1E36A9|nr:cilia- and flagella-associated protein 251-like isoform X1 [Entelurus aequoreus]XP_061888854.1 cilia- and flagella-associated protein 251-like isoform X1 [Entelurus aequoreus]